MLKKVDYSFRFYYQPCIMCAAALAMVGIRRVVFGCKNDRFGGCGSILQLHKPEESVQQTSDSNSIITGDGGTIRRSFGYEIKSGVLEEEAVKLLRSFYDRENIHAPEDVRRKKDIIRRQTRTQETSH